MTSRGGMTFTISLLVQPRESPLTSPETFMDQLSAGYTVKECFTGWHMELATGSSLISITSWEVMTVAVRGSVIVGPDGRSLRICERRSTELRERHNANCGDNFQSQSCAVSTRILRGRGDYPVSVHWEYRRGGRYRFSLRLRRESVWHLRIGSGGLTGAGAIFKLTPPPEWLDGNHHLQFPGSKRWRVSQQPAGRP